MFTADSTSKQKFSLLSLVLRRQSLRSKVSVYFMRLGEFIMSVHNSVKVSLSCLFLSS